MAQELTRFFIVPPEGGCKRFRVMAFAIEDKRGSYVTVSQHNTYAGAEKKLEKLERAAAEAA